MIEALDPHGWPSARFDRVQSSPDVADAAPIYFGSAKWKSGEGDLWPDIFMIGFDPASHIFSPDSINRQITVLDQVDTVLVDSSTPPNVRPARRAGSSKSTIAKVTIGGQYVLGTGAVASATTMRI